MKERIWISNAIRIAGLVGIFYIIRHWMLLYHKVGHIHFNRGSVWKLVVEICLMIFGIYMLRGAPLLVKFLYPKDQEEEDEHLK